jgi:glutamate/tyrosine decarboxylase-like PLP-dependent enzyme
MATKSFKVLNPGENVRPSMVKRLIRSKILQFSNRINDLSTYQLGYPLTPNLADDGIDLGLIDPIRESLLNNVGDPSMPAIFSMNSHQFELGVLEYFADVWGLPHGEAWGYVTNSSTDAIIQAMFTARENFGSTGIVYASESCHYSVRKAATLLGLKMKIIRCDPFGRMDLHALETTIDRTRPVFMVATIGTTMTGAIDDVDGILDIIRDAPSSYVHVDAAFTGAYLPFLEGCEQVVRFRDGISSISTSGHKFIGATSPCGIFVVRQELMDVFDEDVSYIHTKDKTITCSRDGHMAIELWSILSQLGEHGMKKRARDATETAAWFMDRLLEKKYTSYLLHGSTTIVIRRPKDHIVKKYQLAVHGDHAHIVVMPGTSREILMSLLTDIAAQTPIVRSECHS